MKNIEGLLSKIASWFKERRNLMYRIVSIVLILVMIGSGGYIVAQRIIDRNSSSEFDELQDMVNDTSDKDEDDKINLGTSEESDNSSGNTENGYNGSDMEYEVYNVNGEEVKVPNKNLDWDALHEKCADIYGWVFVPGTYVDYPVLQHPTENDFYLKKGLDGSLSYDGNIYSQVEYNSKGWTDYHTVLYGHNRTSNGRMFRTLHYFEDEYFFKVYKYVYIYSEEGVYIYKIFAAYVIGSEHQLATYPVNSYDGLMSYVEMCMKKAADTGYYREIPENEQLGRILTLETCNGEDKSVRYVVQAFLVYDPTQE